MKKYFIKFTNWWRLNKCIDFDLIVIRFEYKKNEYFICTIIIADFQLRFGWECEN